MLLASLHRETKGGFVMPINRHTDQATRHVPFEYITSCKERCMRAAKPQGHTKTLSAAQYNIRSKLAWRSQQS
ncbi:hypothetical protein D3C87_1942680 [compost metagenome]